MILPSSFTRLLAARLLVSTWSCAKKDDPVASSQASYVHNGTLIMCTASAQVSSNGSGTDYLTVLLTTTPQPATGPELLRLNFMKSTSQPLAAYQLLQLAQFYGNTLVATYTPDAFTLTSPSSGRVSGTFSMDSFYSTFPVTFTNGVFTNVPL